MNPDHLALVRDSWSRVHPRGDDLAVAFYARLFDISPESAALFASTDMTAQRRKFTDMLSSIVAALEHPDKLVSEVAGLGHRHVGYGVMERHYAPVGEALVFALEQVLGDSMTKDTRNAWREAYQLLAGLMRRGALASQV